MALHDPELRKLYDLKVCTQLAYLVAKVIDVGALGFRPSRLGPYACSPNHP